MYLLYIYLVLCFERFTNAIIKMSIENRTAINAHGSQKFAQEKLDETCRRTSIKLSLLMVRHSKIACVA